MENQKRGGRKFRFTMRRIADIPKHEKASRSREMEYSDEEVVGLRLLVSKNGRKFFHLRYRFDGRKRVIRIGEFPSTTLQDARRGANEYKNMVSQGVDPMAERDKRTDVMTFQEFAENEYMPYAKANKKSWRDDQYKLNTDMIPTLGKLPLTSVTTRDIELYRARIKVRNTPSTANRHHALLSKMFNLAIQWQFLEKNPCKGVQKYKESGNKERYLDTEEIARFTEALKNNANRVSACAIGFLLFTGLRMGEALQIEWRNVDMEKKTVFLPPETTKSGKGRTVVLNSLAFKVLEEMRGLKENDYVFPGKGPQGHMTSPRRVFAAVKKEAGIENLRIHDLRHTYASLAVNGGANLYEVQKLLGHASSQMTQRYAHLSDKAVRDATDNVAAQISQASG